MADFRLIGQNTASYGPQALAAQGDTLLISGITPTTTLTVGGDLQVNGTVTTTGAAVVGAGASSVTGAITFNNDVTFGDGTGPDAVTFASVWVAGTGVDYSKALSLAPGGTVSATGATTTGVDILIASGTAAPDVTAAKGSLLLKNTDGTAWINTNGAAAWSQLATGSGNSLQAAYTVGSSITTDGTNLVSIDGSAGGPALTLDIGNSTGDILTAHSGISSTPVFSLGGTASGYSLAPAGYGPFNVSGLSLDIAAGAAGTSSGTGGALSLSGGSSPNSGIGGSVTITSGSGVGNFAGAIDIQTGTGNSSAISIGTTNNATVTVGSASNASTLYHAEVTSSPGNAVVALNASATGGSSTAVGSYAIGVDSGDLSHIGAISNANLQTTLIAIDSTIGTLSTSAAHTLQKAYDGAGSGAGAAVTLANSAPVTFTHASGAGGAFSITDAGTGGTSFLLNNTGGSNTILDVQDGGTSVLAIDNAGAFTATPTSGQAATITAAGAGTIDVTSDTGAITVSSSSAAAAGAVSVTSSSSAAASGAITVSSSGVTSSGNVLVSTGTTGATATSGTLTLSSTASGNGSTSGAVSIASSSTAGPAGDVKLYSSTSGLGQSGGDVYVYSSNSNGGTLGGVTLSTGTPSPVVPSSGNIEIRSSADTVVASSGAITSTAATGITSTTSLGNIAITATAGEITFSSAGTAGPTYSQTGDRSLSGFDVGITSIVGALNDLKSTAATDAATTTFVIKNLQTISAGDVVALDGSGALRAEALGTITPAVVGIALTGGSGNGSVTTTVLLAGKYTYTAAIPTATAMGQAVYLGAAGALTTTAPTASGDYLIRIGYVGDTLKKELVIRMDSGTLL